MTFIGNSFTFSRRLVPSRDRPRGHEPPSQPALSLPGTAAGLRQSRGGLPGPAPPGLAVRDPHLHRERGRQRVGGGAGNVGEKHSIS